MSSNTKAPVVSNAPTTSTTTKSSGNQAACNTAVDKYIQLYNSSKGTSCDIDSAWNLNTRSEFCGSCWDQFNSALTDCHSACGSLINEDINYMYESVKFMKSYYCTKPSGSYCDQFAVNVNFKKPYSEWNGSDCKNECTAIIDSAIREHLDNSRLLETFSIDPSLFKNNGNTIQCSSSSSSLFSDENTGNSLNSEQDSGSLMLTANLSLFVVLFAYLYSLF